MQATIQKSLERRKLQSLRSARWPRGLAGSLASRKMSQSATPAAASAAMGAYQGRLLPEKKAMKKGQTRLPVAKQACSRFMVPALPGAAWLMSTVLLLVALPLVKPTRIKASSSTAGQPVQQSSP